MTRMTMKLACCSFGAMAVACAAIAIAQPPGGPGGPVARPPLIEALDADDDGTISAEEIKNASEALFKLDENKDGKLTGEEYRPRGGRQGSPGGAGPDRDFDPAPGGGPRGHEGPNPDRMLTHAMEFDVDRDGKLSQDELKSFIQDFGRRRPGPDGAAGRGGPGADGRGRGPRGRGGPDNQGPERPRRPD